jgi:hypothetical protein
MATLILGAIGTLVGGPIGGSIGALIGRSVDSKIFGSRGTREGPRLTELKITTSSYGAPIPRHFGRMRVAGQIIWATDLVEHKESQGSKGSPSVTNYTYSASFAVALSSRRVLSIGRIWADGKLLRGEAGDLKTAGSLRLHAGTGDQALDPLIAAAEGAGQCPAYRGLAYAVFEDLQLSDFGNRIPSLTFEVLSDQAELSLADLLEGVIDNYSAAIPLPGIAGLSNEGSLVETLASLDPFFPVDCDACDELLELRPDLREIPALTLPEAATSSDRDDFGGKAGFSRQRGGESEAPVALLRYYDVDRDYQPGAQRASGRPLPGQPRAIDLPAALNASAARQAVERAAKRANWSRQTVSWRVTQLDPAVRPGQTVRLPGHAGLWRVREWEWRDHGVDLILARLSPLTEGAGAADPGRANRPPDLALAPTKLAACEIPWDGNAGTSVPLILALASSTSAAWPGASLYADHGDGSLQPLGPSGRTRATIGTALSVLESASPLLFDRHASVIVELAAEDLTLIDATMRQLAMGANRALIGAEIVQFSSVEPLGQGQWRLTGFLRGRGGTESAVEGHAVGEVFALLDGTGTVLSPDAVGDLPDAAVVAISLGDSQPVTAGIALRGIGTRPLSPVHPRWSRDADGSHRLTWVRRARGGWLWKDGVDLPLSEQSEAYDITFGAAAQIIARWDSGLPELVLTTSELSTLLAAAPSGLFAVRQRGDRALSQPLLLDPPT